MWQLARISNVSYNTSVHEATKCTPYEVLDVLGTGNVKINIKGKLTVVYVNLIRRSHINKQN